jgi:hypothetical protein
VIVSDDNRLDYLKGLLDENQRADLKAMMNHTRTIFETLNQIFQTIPSLLNSDGDAYAPLAQCLKEVLKMYRALRKLDKTLKIGFVSYEPVQDLFTSIKAEMKKVGF